MDISSINSVSGISSSGGSSIDEEYKRIIEKLRALGLEPSGNKASDKAKLREYELRQIKAELGSKGKGSVNKTSYITVSPAEIEQIKEQLQSNSDEEENSTEHKEKAFAMENQTGATQLAAMNSYFLKKKKVTEGI